MIHPLNTIDLLSHSFFQQISLPNMARAKYLANRKDTLNTSRLLLLYLSNPRSRRYSWLYTQADGIRGLISVATLPGELCWEIDSLGVSEHDIDQCCEIFEELSYRATKLGIERIFLRLEQGCPLQEAAARSDFKSYLTEYLYQVDVDGSEPDFKLLDRIRQRKAEDDFALFQLYLSTVPIHVKQAEGLTLQEWRSSGERGAPGYGKSLVQQQNNEVMGWLRLYPVTGSKHFEAIAKTSTDLLNLYFYSLSFRNRYCDIYWLVPDFQKSIFVVPQERKLVEIQRYLKMVKRLSVPVKKPIFAPSQA